MVHNLDLVQAKLKQAIQKAKGHNGVDQLKDELLLTCESTGKKPIEVLVELADLCMYSETEAPEHIHWPDLHGALRDVLEARVKRHA